MSILAFPNIPNNSECSPNSSISSKSSRSPSAIGADIDRIRERLHRLLDEKGTRSTRDKQRLNLFLDDFRKLWREFDESVDALGLEGK